MKYIVYKTTNLKCIIDGHNCIYIGVHKVNENRIDDKYLGCGVYAHRDKSYLKSYTNFQYAVKKYGPKAFKREILYIFDTAEEAYKKESEIVNENFLKLPYVYNMVLGGRDGICDPRFHCSNVNQFTLDGKLITKWKTSLDAVKYYNCSLYRIQDAVFRHIKYMNYYWSREDKIDISNYGSTHSKPVYLYTKEGKYFECFNSRTECAEYLKCYPQSVSHAIRNGISIKGYYPSDSLVDIYIPKPRVKLKEAKLYLYQNGKYIGEFVGKEIFPRLNMYSYSKLDSIINSNCGWYKDFYISPEYLTEDEVKQKPKKFKSVDVYDKNMNFIETLESVKAMKEKYNIRTEHATLLLRGAMEHKQYIFKVHNK